MEKAKAPRVSYGDIKVVLTFDSLDKNLWFDYSNETLSAVLLHSTIYIFSILHTSVWYSS